MLLEASSLFQLTAALWIGATVSYPTNSAGNSAWVALRQSLFSFFGQMGFVTGAGALVLKFSPWWTVGFLGDMTLAELHEQQNRLTDIAERTWWLPVSLTLLVLASASLGWSAIQAQRARVLGMALEWSFKLKAFAGLVAIFGLSAIGLQQRAVNDIPYVDSQISSLGQLRLALAEDFVHFAVQSLAAPIADSLPRSVNFSVLSNAYQIASPYLVFSRTESKASTWQMEFAEKIVQRVPDLNPSGLKNLQNNLRAEFSKSEKSADKLLAKLTEAAFDQALADPLRKEFATIDNPMLNELLGAFLDPLLARPLREAVMKIATTGAQSLVSYVDMRAEAKQAWATLPRGARSRIFFASTRAQLAMSALLAEERIPLGDPTWQVAHDRLRSLRRPGTENDVNNQTVRWDAWSAASSLRGALDTLLVKPIPRQRQVDAAMGNWLLDGRESEERNRYLADWGGAVAYQMGLRTASNRLDAYSALRHWYGRQPAVLSKAAEDLLDPTARTPRELSERLTSNAKRRNEELRRYMQTPWNPPHQLRPPQPRRFVK